jgi:predicted MFS family arabinose efflux permease
MSKELPDDAEAGGGLLVAVVQLAIALGAAAGGWVFDASGYQATFSRKPPPRVALMVC